MKKKSIIKNSIFINLKNTYCRLMPSRVSGVGVFAIRDIPKNINPFEVLRKSDWQEFKTSELRGLNKEVLEMIEDFFVVEKDGRVLIPDFGLNGMDVSFFLNHSKKPNIKTDDGFNFFALRKIKKGEELSVSYKGYDWKYK